MRQSKVLKKLIVPFKTFHKIGAIFCHFIKNSYDSLLKFSLPFEVKGGVEMVVVKLSTSSSVELL